MYGFDELQLHLQCYLLSLSGFSKVIKPSSGSCFRQCFALSYVPHFPETGESFMMTTARTLWSTKVRICGIVPVLFVLFSYFPLFFFVLDPTYFSNGLGQCSQRGSPSVLSQDEDGRQLVVPSGHFLKLPAK